MRSRKASPSLRVPAGFQIELVSNRLRGARFLAVAPNGDVIVSQVSRGQVVAVHPGSPADSPPMLVAEGLERPNGLAFRGNDLYIATWSGVVVVPGYPRGIGSPQTLFNDMPHNPDHNNRALALARMAASSFLRDPTATSVLKTTPVLPRSSTTMPTARTERSTPRGCATPAGSPSIGRAGSGQW